MLLQDVYTEYKEKLLHNLFAFKLTKNGGVYFESESNERQPNGLGRCRIRIDVLNGRMNLY